MSEALLPLLTPRVSTKNVSSDIVRCVLRGNISNREPLPYSIIFQILFCGIEFLGGSNKLGENVLSWECFNAYKQINGSAKFCSKENIWLLFLEVNYLGKKLPQKEVGEECSQKDLWLPSAFQLVTQKNKTTFFFLRSERKRAEASVHAQRGVGRQRILKQITN